MQAVNIKEARERFTSLCTLDALPLSLMAPSEAELVTADNIMAKAGDLLSIPVLPL